MSTVDWIVLISVVVYLLLSIIAFKFPRGRGDWHKDWRETLYLMLSTIVFLMLLFLLWYVSAVVSWPPALIVVLWASVITLIVLVLVGIFVPHGIRLSFRKKQREVSEEEE
jgi:amino acid transporter